MLQRRMNKKLYQAIWWVIVILVVLSFLITMVMPLWAASSGQTVTAQPGYQAETASLAEAASMSAFISWVTRPWVSAVLVALGLAGLTLELFTMAWGAAGTLGIVSLLVFFVGGFLSGMADGKELSLFILGVGLLLTEILAFPGVWLVGLAGFASLAAAVILSSGSVLLGVIYLGIAAVVTFLTLLCAFKIIDLGKIWRGVRPVRR